MPFTNYLTVEQKGTVVGMVNLNGFAGSIDLDAITNKFNERPQVPNTNIPLVPLVLNIRRISAELGSATFTKMTDGSFPVFFQACLDNNHEQANVIVDLWQDTGKFTTDELVKIRALTATTEPDQYAPVTVESNSLWETQFLPAFPTFTATIDGVTSNRCHKALISEATGITIV